MENVNLVVGAGFAGLVVARVLAEKGEKVLVIERRSHIAGNAYDERDGGVLGHKYGAHIFHTNDKEVWEFVTRFAKFYPYMHKVGAMVNGELVPIPFNLNSLYKAFPRQMAKAFEDKLLAKFEFGTKVSVAELKKVVPELAEFLYDNIFTNYTAKQWNCKPEELDKSVLERVPVNISKDERYFNDKFQGIPFEGYTALCQAIADHPNIQLKLNTEFSHEMKAKRVFYSGAIDEYYDYKFGELAYRSLRFEFLNLACERFQPYAVVNYPNNYDYTRITEFKQFLPFASPSTLIAFEYPKAWKRGDERYYPIPNPANEKLYAKYAKEAKKEPNLYFIGRLGRYKYFNMDQVIKDSLELAKNL